MADENFKISELDSALQLNNGDLMEVSQENGSSATGYTSVKTTMTQLGNKLNSDMSYAALDTTAKSVIGAINEIAQGGGGASAYSDLTDVQLSNLQDGQISKYNATAQKWKNAEDKAEHIGSASGAIATFETDVVANLKSLVVDIDAVQASGTPTPSSPLPISGFSQANIGVMGKNLIDDSKYYQAGSNTVVIGQTLPNTNRTIFLPAGTYTIKVNSTASASIYYDFGNGSTRIGNVSEAQTFTLAENSWCSFSIYSSGGFSPSDYTSIQLELGSIATEYESFVGNTYLVEFGQTIYVGRLIYANGAWAIKATYDCYTFTGSESWSYHSSGFFYLATTIQNFKVNSNALTSNGIKVRLIASGSNMLIRVYISDNSDYIDSSTDMNTILTNGIQYLYELATPVIIPITSSTRVKTISGVNNIYADTGDISSVEFFKNAIPAQVINGTAPHIYSTDEQVVGKWIDGSVLYEKTFNKSNLDYGNNTWWNNILGTNGSGIEIVRFEGYYSNNQNNARYSINAFYRASTTTASACINTDNDDINLFNNMGYIIDRVNITIRYIKVPNPNNAVQS